MGNRETKILIYTFAGTFIVLLALALSGGTRRGSVLGFFKGSGSATSRTDFYKVPGNKYSVTRHGHGKHSSSEPTYKNDYRPSTAYARAYVEPQEVNHPLISSAKFISKKDKLKKAKKKNNKLLAKKKNKKNGNARSIGDEDDEFFDEEDDSSSMAGGMAPQVTAAANNVNGPKKSKKEEEEESMNTVEFWEKPIFIEEDFQAVTKLIESYQIRKVSNNVFYTLVDDMTHDERPNLREYGLIALSATPSAKSFSELAWMKHNDNTTDLRTDAGKEITNYTNATRVSHVVGALRASTTETPKATLEALSVLTATSKKYASLREQGTGGETVDTTGLSSLEPKLDSALQLIQERYSNSTDPKIKTEADKTVAAITDFISL